jgi:hypothetical protein
MSTTRYNYSNLQNTDKTDCEVSCICRGLNERSVKDRLYYNWFVLNQPMDSLVPKDNMCNNKNNVVNNKSWRK